MVSVQRSLLNATGPLCCLHDALESNDNINVSNKDVKLMLEQALCLLHSANYQISVLRRKRVLAAINKAKVNLGDLPLPNAKRMLFGDDFPSLASKQADLSRVLSKTLYPTFWIWASPQEELLYLWVFYLFKRLGLELGLERFFCPRRTVQQESTSTYLSGSK